MKELQDSWLCNPLNKTAARNYSVYDSKPRALIQLVLLRERNNCRLFYSVVSVCAV
jgi:hypothetical protein